MSWGTAGTGSPGMNPWHIDERAYGPTRRIATGDLSGVELAVQHGAVPGAAGRLANVIGAALEGAVFRRSAVAVPTAVGRDAGAVRAGSGAVLL